MRTQREALIPVFLGTLNILRKTSEIRWGKPGVQRSLGEQRHFVSKPNTNALADALTLGHLGHRTGIMLARVSPSRERRGLQ